MDYNKGIVEDYYKSRNYLKALSYIEKFLRQNPDNFELNNDYGLIYTLVYGFEAGVGYLKKSIDFKKDNLEAITNIVEIYIQNNLPFSAIKILETSDISNYPNLKEKLNFLKKNFTPEKVSFYIPVYNVEKYIVNCLNAIFNQSYPIHEVIIVDDSSPDNSISKIKEFIDKYGDKIKILTHDTNRGLAAARNSALQNATGDYLATVDTDALPEETFLESIMMEFFKNKYDKKLAGIGGKLLEANSLSLTDRWREVHMKQHWGDKNIDNPEFLFGSTSVYKISALKEIGGFNESYKTNYEDCDLAIRLKKSGYKISYIANAKAVHLRSDNLLSLITTYYNWVAAPYKGKLTSFESIKDKHEFTFNILSKFTTQDISNKRFHLLYPEFFSALFWVIKDLVNSDIDFEEKIDTAYALSGVIFYGLNQNLNISDKLKDFIYQDTERFTDLLQIKKKVSEIASIKSDDPNYISLAIGRNFPKANIQLISSVGATISKFLAFEPMLYKMIEVSRVRIEYEENLENQSPNKQSKILLLNLPWRDGTRYGIRAGSRWPFTNEVPQENWQIPPSYVPYPFFLGYATSILKEDGFTTHFIDAIAEGVLDEEFFQRVKGVSPDIIFIETATASIYNDINYVRKLKTFLPDSKIIFSGTHVSYFKDKFLQEYPCVDGIIVGEIEQTALKIAQYFEKHHNFEGFNEKGFMFYDKNSLISGSSDRGELVEIDKLPLPERLTTPVYNYEDLFAGMLFPSLQIHSTRGCPFGCIYCVWPQVLYQSRSYRTRDPIKVVDEIEEMIKIYGYKSFYFDDDTFNIGKERILKICEEIKRRGLDKIPWSAMSRADTSDFETLKAMKDAGLVSIKFGVESATQQLVDACGKGLDLNKVEESVRYCQELGLKYHLTFTFGLPGETKETIEKSIQYSFELNPDTCQFSLTTPFPGTKHFDMAKEKGLLLTEEWDKYDGNRYTVMRGENLTREELEGAVKDAYQRWDEFDRKRKGAKSKDLSKFKKPSICYDKRNLKVIFVCQDGYDLAPARVRCYNFSKELNKLGIKSEVLSFYDNLKASDQVGPCENMSDYEKLKLNIKAYEKLKDEKNAIFYVQKSGYHFLAPYLVAEENGNKIIFDYDDFDLGCYPFQNLHKFIPSLSPDKLFEDLVKKSEICIGSSKFLVDLMAKHNHNSHYIVTGVDMDKFNYGNNNKESNGTVEIIWMGHVWSSDIFKSLLYCVTNYLSIDKEAIDKSRLNLILFGTYSKVLEESIKKYTPKLCNSKIVFHSKKAPDEIPNILNKTDIGLAPLDTSNPFTTMFNKSKSPTKVFEYMACKVAVIGTKIGEIENLITDGNNGYLFNNQNEVEFKEKLTKLILDDNMRREFQNRAYKKVKEHFSLESIGKKLAKIIYSNV